MKKLTLLIAMLMATSAWAESNAMSCKEIPEVARVTYDISSKPTVAIEWE